ncbi:MAG: cellulose synthase operon protein YhjQ/BcsQ, partial [Roseibium sp.]
IDPGSKFDKAVESLSYEIEDYETAFQASVVQLTSSEDGEGKSSVASALAASVAAQGLSVLLVDADLPNAGLSSMMGMTESRGLIELIKDGYWDFDDAALGYGCVDVVPAGNGGRRNVGLGGALVMRAYLEEARDRYDLILIDGPSVNNSADALILAELSDHIVFIVRKNWGSKESLTRALFQLDQSRIAGLVLNAA